jgi:hypothetical protein
MDERPKLCCIWIETIWVRRLGLAGCHCSDPGLVRLLLPWSQKTLRFSPWPKLSLLELPLPAPLHQSLALDPKAHLH